MGRLPLTGPAELYACLYAREFAAQSLCRLRPDLQGRAFAVIEGEAPRQQVCSLNAKARIVGVVRGMTRVELETIPSVAALSRSLREEASTKAILVECAGGFSPRVEAGEEAGAFFCVVDIAGTERLFGSAEVVAAALRERMKAIGVVGTVAVSSNFYTAICVARGTARTRPLMVARGEEAAMLSTLPVSLLNLSARHAETFSLWGIRTLGALAALPEEALIARIGQEAKRLRQMAQGVLPHLFRPVEGVFKLAEHRELEYPEDNLESLLFCVNVMLEHILVRALNRALALASVTLALKLEGGGLHTRTVKPALPNADKQIWIKLIHLDLEAHPPGAQIVAVSLTAEPGNMSKVQLGLFSSQLPESARLDVTLARIQAIVGEDNAGRVVLKDTHRQDGFHMERFVVPTGEVAVRSASHTVTAMRQLRPEESIDVQLRNGHPATFLFRAKQYRVTRAYGPWFTSGEWWNGSQWDVHQWDIIAHAGDEMLFCCVARDLVRAAWMMVGIYD